MNTTQTERRPQTPSQWLVVAKLLGVEALRGLLSATAVIVGVALAMYVLGRRLGWQFIEAPGGEATLGVFVNGQSVAVVGAAGWVPIAVGTAAIVMGIVLTATRTRTLISVGITRRAIVVGTAVTLAGIVIYTLLVAALVTLVIGPAIAVEFLGGDGSDPTAVIASETSSLILGVVGGAAVTVMFLRWPWWVGVLALAALSITLSAAGAGGALDRASAAGLPWIFLAFAVLLAVAYWAMMRRLPVR
ncbi:MAG: hypothetical protein WBG36_14285 [Ornithinimicrobium sp.]